MPIFIDPPITIDLQQLTEYASLFQHEVRLSLNPIGYEVYSNQEGESRLVAKFMSSPDVPDQFVAIELEPENVEEFFFLHILISPYIGSSLVNAISEAFKRNGMGVELESLKMKIIQKMFVDTSLPEARSALLKEWCEMVCEGDDNSARAALSMLALIDDQKTFPEQQVELRFSADKVIPCSALEFALYYKRTTVANEILKLFPACKHGRANAGVFPLFMCAGINLLEFTQVLIASDIDLCAQNSLGENALMAATTPEMCRLILDAAEARGVLVKLLSQVTRQGNSVLQVFLRHDALSQIEEILDRIKDHKELLKILDQHILHSVRTKYWQRHGDPRYDRICQTIRSLLVDSFERLPHTFPLSEPNIDFQKQYQLLFGESAEPDAKRAALKRIVTELACLLDNPVKCMRYLQALEKGFREFYLAELGRPFPELCKDSYDFATLNQMWYPVPREHYVGIKKRSALQRYLITILQAHGLAKEAFKWIGFIPAQIADSHLIKGDFVTEDRLSTGLFHGKLSHMLQLTVLALAIEAQDIKLNYQDGGIERSIKETDILAFMLTEISSSSANFWVRVLDSRVKDHMSFRDPLQVHTIIMYHGEQFGICAVRDALIDSFCKGLIRQHEAFQSIPGFQALTLHMFFDKMRDNLQHKFNGTPVLWERIMEMETKQHSQFFARSSSTDTERYAVITTHHPQTPLSDHFFPPDENAMRKPGEAAPGS